MLKHQGADISVLRMVGTDQEREQFHQNAAFTVAVITAPMVGGVALTGTLNGMFTSAYYDDAYGFAGSTFDAFSILTNGHWMSKYFNALGKLYGGASFFETNSKGQEDKK